MQTRPYHFKPERESDNLSLLTGPDSDAASQDGTRIADFRGRQPGDVLLLRYFTTHGGRVKKGDYLAVIEKIISDQRVRMSHYYAEEYVETSNFHFGEGEDGTTHLFAEAWHDAPTIAMEARANDPQ